MRTVSSAIVLLSSLAAGAAEYYNGSWSPDGARIAFESARDGRLQLYAMHADGSGQGRIADRPTIDYAPDWSPAGEWIAFISRQEQASVMHDLCVVRPDGSGRRCFATEANEIGPRWSADGRWIFFVQNRPPKPLYRDTTPAELAKIRSSSEITRIAADGSSLTQLTNDDVPDCCVHPARDAIYFTSGENARVHAMDENGEDVRALDAAVAEGVPSLDEARFAYTRNGQDDVAGVWVYDRATAAARRIVPGEPAIDENRLRERYEKSEARIAMRDGVKLHTTIYAPKEAPTARPMLLTRTPYGCAPYGENEFPEPLYPDPEFARDGWIFVCQDVRGRPPSQGTWIHMRPDPADAYDTIEWLLANVPSHNGRIALWGASYPGFYVLSSMIDAHPAIRCAMPAAPQTDWWHEDMHHNGAFFLSSVFWFAAELEGVTIDPRERDGYDFFLQRVGGLAGVNERFLGGRSAMWREAVEHPNRDTFWNERDLRPRLTRVAPAVLTVGGWFDDANLFGSLHAYRAIEKLNPTIRNTLVIGPWEHTGWDFDQAGDRHGDVPFHSATTHFFRFEVQRKFLRACLEDESFALPEALIFETGRNVWRSFASWPPAGLTPISLYLAEAGALAREAPPKAGFDEYPSDPRKPVPYTEENRLTTAHSFMSADQRFAARRPDVLVYSTPALDAPLTVAGPIEADLWFSTDREDADVIVKLIDVQPDDAPSWPDMPRGRKTAGYQQLVRAEVFRGRFRDDAARPKPFVPHQPARLRFTMNDVLHTFEPGHRLMIQVQSTWFPLVDRNPQAWVPNIFLATDRDFAIARHRVHRGGEHASRIVFGSAATEPIDDGEVGQRGEMTFYQDLAWSPDGSRIAYSVMKVSRSRWEKEKYDALRGSDYDIYVMNVDGTARRRLTDNPAYDLWLSWAPDSLHVVFSSERKGNTDLYVMDVDGSGLTRLTDEPGKESGPTLVFRWKANRLCVQTRRSLAALGHEFGWLGEEAAHERPR